MIPASVRQTLRDRRGAALAVAGVTMIALLGSLGLALDTAALYNHKRLLQTAADAGAYDGGYEIYRGNTSLIESAAVSAAADNGYLDGTAEVVVTVNHPPLSGQFAGDNQAVEVLVSQPAPPTFMSLFGFGPTTVPARAVAWAGANDQNCVYVMDPTSSQTLWTTSNSHLDASCGIRVNSNHGQGVMLESSACIESGTLTTAGQIRDVSDGDACGGSDGINVIDGPFTEVLPRSPDPLGHLTPPASGGCDYNDWEWDDDENDGFVTPGQYCGGIRVKQGTVYMSPGIYVLKGDPTLVLENSSHLEGSGVTIYLTSHGSDYKPMSFQSSSTADLRAPTGPDGYQYKGILFYEDPAVGNPSEPHRWESSNLMTLEGAWYFPEGKVQFESNVHVTASYVSIVAYRMELQSSAYLDVNADYSGLGGKSPLRRLALVE